MNTEIPKGNTSHPHPGKILRSELEEHKLSQRELAYIIGKSAPMINSILNGTKDISTDIAILLEEAMPGGMKASDWVMLQSAYDLELKRLSPDVEQRLESLKIWNFLRNESNTSALRRQMFDGEDLNVDMKNVLQTIGVNSIAELETSFKDTQKCFKKSNKIQTNYANLFAWTLIVKYESLQQRLSGFFMIEHIKNLIKSLNDIFYKNFLVLENCRRIFAFYGIKFIVDEKRLDKVPVDGYSFWRGKNPTIVVTKRKNRIDNLAFTIMHELGHIVLHLQKDSITDFIDVDSSIKPSNAQETEANDFADKALWNDFPPNTIFSEIQDPYAAQRILETISEEREVNIGIVVGQYQHYCQQKKIVKNPYAIGRDLIPKIL